MRSKNKIYKTGMNDIRGKKNPRYKWLTEVINEREYRRGAEVGVDLGTTTQYLLLHCPELLIYAVDLWDRPTAIGKHRGQWVYHPDLDYAQRTFNDRMYPFRDRVIVLKGISWEVSERVEDNSLDFVFIDADHKYESVVKDIKAWMPKLKPGGMLSGHDLKMDGVRKALEKLTTGYIDVKMDKCWETKKEYVKI
jgi:hypothetical protein